ncbi:MAG TPA: hypothetical protein VNA88_02665 [Candidatus Kapabacteria bacterium]|nr:hypothetical protein [Candidatus Kapabacteria bacterium]
MPPIDEMIEEIRLGLELALLQQSTLQEQLRLLNREALGQRCEFARTVLAHQQEALDRAAGQRR